LRSVTPKTRMSALSRLAAAAVVERDEAQERLDRICAGLGIRLEQITCESNEWAPDGYGGGAWLGEFERRPDARGSNRRPSRHAGGHAMKTALTLVAASLWAVLATPVASDIACPASYPPLPPPRPAPEPHAVPITVRDQEAFVDVLLGDKKFRMLIDTGATCLYITPSVAKVLIAAGAAIDTGEKDARFADGKITVRRRLIIKKVTVGDRILSNVEGLVHPADQGLMLVGFPILNQMGRFTIDTETKQLIFG
jgi:hypothetical protein